MKYEANIVRFHITDVFLSDTRRMKTNKSGYKFSLVQHLVFLYRVPVDIDQLKLIMLLVGTPGPELLMKISSESVSSHSYARFFF